MFKNVAEFIEKASNPPVLKLAVAAAGDEEVLESVKKADELGIVEPVLVGNKGKIEEALEKVEYDFNGKVIATSSKRESAHKVMQLIAEGKADIPMKGLISTKTILRALLDESYALRTGRLLSLVTIVHLKKDNRFIIITDGGMNIAPDLEDKVQIINNAVELARAIGIKKPRVAPLAAVEKVNPKMPDTMDAAILSKMSDRGQISGAIVDGPLALDNAISKEAAERKGIDSPVAGQADILLVPDIEAGNILYKSMVFYFEMEAASVIYGAKVPLVITSRADRARVKLNSIALAKLVVQGLKNNN
ncbi:bifunctional enoyl-CoA hydratase/phosphate acetyltransferase [Halothermothrix orenii]|uniref:Phosphate butyryltransferase n=1 Tax=Halothermothrix orenii (strain H 168 / OCM 544 / DSM 9562) TaxID=373903 RepID=B8CVW2_HALOH|nr:bifunctional enoyl-CoA hydratase/phosphate acetyltransferase [Halothermothrix orenii]ACL69431.1 Phosphate butyryltransferase [Halothermothrix orenii H 168]